MKTDKSSTGDVAKGAIISGISAIALFFVNYNLDYAGIGGTSIFGGSPGFLFFLQGMILAFIFIGGAIIGLILALTVVISANIFKLSHAYKSLLIILIPPLIIITAFLYLKFTDIKSKLHQENEEKLFETNPQGLKLLIEKIKNDPVSADPVEKRMLWLSVFGDNPTIQEELPFLLEYFKNDTSGTGGLMEHNKLTEAQIRFIYSNFKQTEGGWARIYDDIIPNESTPPDILNDIINQLTNGRDNNRSYMLENAKTAFAKKQIKQ